LGIQDVPLNRRNDDATRKLQHLRKILDDLYSFFWQSAMGLEVDDTLLRRFEWALDEAAQEPAELLVTKSGSNDANALDEEDG
jgi:hypothetical protein